MGPLVVVRSEPRVRHCTHFRQGFKEVRVEDLGPIAAIEALDVGVLIGLTRLDVVDRDPPLGTPVDKDLREKFGTVVHADRCWPAMKGGWPSTESTSGRKASPSTRCSKRCRSR